MPSAYFMRDLASHARSRTTTSGARPDAAGLIPQARHDVGGRIPRHATPQEAGEAFHVIPPGEQGRLLEAVGTELRHAEIRHELVAEALSPLRGERAILESSLFKIYGFPYMSQIRRRAELFQAFADPTRLRILALLTVGELCVCHLVEALEESQPKVSRHLATLRSAGLVTPRRDGRWVHYALADTHDPATRRLVACATDGLAPLPEMQADRERLSAVLDRDCC